MKGTLSVIHTDHNTSPLRTKTVTGEGSPIIVGDHFRLIGDGLVFGNRAVITSEIQEILHQDEVETVFRTESTTYRWLHG
jgi:hypothetical protein